MYAQSNLPPCPSSGHFHNCFGTFTFASGNKYVGEWRENAPRGNGVMYFSNGDIYSDKFGLHASGTYTFSDGRPSIEAFWSYDNTVRKKVLNSLIGEAIIGSLIKATPPVTQIISGNSNDRVNSEIEAERKKRQELELQLASTKERERITADLDTERRKRQELEEQLRVAQQSTQPEKQPVTSGIERRVALVVGNANYKVRPLKNAKNDADDVSRSLRTTGFEVIDLRDATLPQMRTAVRQFGDRLVNNDVGLVYYSGHGVEVKGRNYFIPVNADIQREDEIADQGLDVSLILEKMSTAGKGVNILIVDACRDDPFGRSFRSSSRGLANMDAPRGTIIAYATSPGKVASDGDPRERNSPYTKHLVKAMKSPNKPIEQVFKEVRRAVQEETKNQQTPWENTSLSGDFFFRVQR